MSREEALIQIEQAFGSVPGWIAGMPDPMLGIFWNLLGWQLSDSQLSARDKALVAFGVASAINCEY